MANRDREQIVTPANAPTDMADTGAPDPQSIASDHPSKAPSQPEDRKDSPGAAEPVTEPKTGDEMLRQVYRGGDTPARRTDPANPGAKSPRSGTDDDPHKGLPDTTR